MDEIYETAGIALLRNLGVGEVVIERVVTEVVAVVEGRKAARVSAAVERRRAQWRVQDLRRRMREAAGEVEGASVETRRAWWREAQRRKRAKAKEKT
jgi:hypothetical protein